MENLQSYLDKALKEVKFVETDKEDAVTDYDIEAEIAELIANARSEKGLTQGQLAEKSKVTQANISKIERGNYCPSVAILKRLATAMDKRLRIEFVEEGM